MNRKTIIGICVSLAVILSLGVYLFIVASNKKVVTTEPVNINFSEKRVTQDELIIDADLITRCEVGDVIERETKTIPTTGSSGVKFNAVIPTVTYRLKPVEGLKGINIDEIKLVMLDSSDNVIKAGEEYVVFLNNADNGSIYNLLSYNQGLNRIKPKNANRESSMDSLTDEEIELETVVTKEITNYSELKQRIKELGM